MKLRLQQERSGIYTPNRPGSYYSGNTKFNKVTPVSSVLEKSYSKKDRINKIAIQPKLTIGQPNDKREREADRTAEKVMRMHGPMSIQKGCLGCKESANTPGSSKSQTEVNFIREKLDLSKSSGETLSGNTRVFMEKRLGTDFSNVKIHNNSDSVNLNRQLNSQAFTNGNNIYFNQGRYNPETSQGKHLLAHELTHVIQQNSNLPLATIQRTITVRDHTSQPPHLNKTKETKKEKKAINPLYKGKSNAGIIKLMLNKLCSKGMWDVDSNGKVYSTANNFCMDANIKASGTPSSCECLCELEKKSNQDVTIIITDKSIDYAGRLQSNSISEGQGVSRTDKSVTLKNRKFFVAISGLDYMEAKGTGDTKPVNSIPYPQIIRDPAWIILAHEMCGHVRLDLSKKDYDYLHEHTEDYDKSAIDVENKIRREHSTSKDNYGIRLGAFDDLDDNVHYGALVKIRKNMKISEIENMLNIPSGYYRPSNKDMRFVMKCKGKKTTLKNLEIHKRIFSYDKTWMNLFISKTCRNVEFPKDSMFYMEGIFWHHTIKGETKARIAKMWSMNTKMLDNANAGFNNFNTFKNNQQLPEGMKIIIPYRRASKRLFFIK